MQSIRWHFFMLMTGVIVAATGCSATSNAGPGREKESRCNVSECVDGVMRSCEGIELLNCTENYGACGVFTRSGIEYAACACIPGNEDFINGSGSSYVKCVDGQLRRLTCPTGTTYSGVASAPCDCSNADDGVCPQDCPRDPDCASCTPSCSANQECGSNGCNGECGIGCDASETCVDRVCAPRCTPTCAGKCGGPNGCGGTCPVVACASGQTCNATSWTCVATGGGALCTNTCEWSSDGECDDGGPDSEYSACAFGTDCADCGPRSDSACTPSCAGKCGGPNGCGGTCPTVACPSGQTCNATTHVCTGTTPTGGDVCGSARCAENESCSLYDDTERACNRIISTFRGEGDVYGSPPPSYGPRGRCSDECGYDMDKAVACGACATGLSCYDGIVASCRRAAPRTCTSLPLLNARVRAANARFGEAATATTIYPTSVSIYPMFVHDNGRTMATSEGNVVEIEPGERARGDVDTLYLDANDYETFSVDGCAAYLVAEVVWNFPGYEYCSMQIAWNPKASPDYTISDAVVIDRASNECMFL